MATRIPITKDSFGFDDNRSKIWEDMERDMESRRREWEDEIEKMSSDFFTLRPETGKFPLSDKFGLTDRMQPSRDDRAPLRDEGKALIEKDERGNPVFRVRFDVSDYKPDEVNVKMDANKMQVHAKHETKDGGKSVSREFSREINIPREIDPMSLQCSISKEGVLCVEAPFPTPQYSVTSGPPPPTSSYQQPQQFQTTANVTPKYQSQPPPPPSSHPYQQVPNYTPSPAYQSQAPPYQPSQSHSVHQERSTPVFHQSTPVHTMQSPPGAPYQQPPSYQQHSKPAVASNVITIQKDTKFKVEIDIEDFAPEELTVKTVDKKVVVSGRREVKEANRSSSKELCREYNIPDTVDPITVKAFFTDGGRLIVEAPYKANTNGTFIH
ncbi:hypothetical protein SNE40_003908 [Patella caerulea]|uniref:SHSP domain-containing protein n=1 Tax=Patella caerulea TaxID=87958 RepID=A0AAN8Q5Z1_PATCE